MHVWYSEHFPTVRQIVESFDSSGVIVSRAKEAISNINLHEELLQLTKYRGLITLLGKAESAQYTTLEAATDLANLNFHDEPCSIKDYIDKRLSKNDLHAILDPTRDDVSPATCAQLQACQPTTCTVERSFSILKHILRKDRSFSLGNIRHYAIMAFNGHI